MQTELANATGEKPPAANGEQKGGLSLPSEKSLVLSPHGVNDGMNLGLWNICVTGRRGCRLPPVTTGTVLGDLGKGRGGLPFLKANEIFAS